jgi:hypothetical protein
MGLFDFLKPRKSPIDEAFDAYLSGNKKRGKQKLSKWSDDLAMKMAIAQQQHDDELVEKIARRLKKENFDND